MAKAGIASGVRKEPISKARYLTVEAVPVAMSYIQLKDLSRVKYQAWIDSFGVQPRSDGPTIADKHLTQQNGSYQLAYLGMDAVGWIKHRPIYGLLGNAARILTLNNHVPPVPRAARIHNIDVLPRFQKQKVASALMRAALVHYPPQAEVITDAVGSPDIVHGWLERLGLQPNNKLKLPAYQYMPAYDIFSDPVVLERTRYDSATVEQVLSNL